MLLHDNRYDNYVSFHWCVTDEIGQGRNYKGLWTVSFTLKEF